MIQLSRMPPPPTHRACSTPNPPWWCGEPQDVIITPNLWVLVVLALLIGIVYLVTKNANKE